MVLRLSPVKCISNGGKQATDGKSDIDCSRNNAYERVANLFTLLPILFEISPSYRYRKQVWGEKVK